VLLHDSPMTQTAVTKETASMLLHHSLITSVANLVGSGPFWSDLDPNEDIWNRIRILALIDEPTASFLVCVKAKNILVNICFLNFWFMNVLFREIFRQKISRRNLSEDLFRSGCGSDIGSGCLQKSDPDPEKTSGSTTLPITLKAANTETAPVLLHHSSITDRQKHLKGKSHEILRASL
jgi:hypothetical protein